MRVSLTRPNSLASVSHALRSRPNEERRKRPKPKKKVLRKQQQSPAIDEAVDSLIQEQQALLKSMIDREGGGVMFPCSVGHDVWVVDRVSFLCEAYLFQWVPWWDSNITGWQRTVTLLKQHDISWHKAQNNSKCWLSIGSQYLNKDSSKIERVALKLQLSVKTAAPLRPFIAHHFAATIPCNQLALHIRLCRPGHSPLSETAETQWWEAMQ